jgi:hypothetical protein
LGAQHPSKFLISLSGIVFGLWDAMHRHGDVGTARERQTGAQTFFDYFSSQVITFWISFGVQGNGAMQCRFSFPDHQDDEP